MCRGIPEQPAGAVGALFNAQPRLLVGALLLLSGALYTVRSTHLLQYTVRPMHLLCMPT